MQHMSNRKTYVPKVIPEGACGGSFKEQTCKSSPDNLQRPPTTCVRSDDWADLYATEGARQFSMYEKKSFQPATTCSKRGFMDQTSATMVF